MHTVQNSTDPTAQAPLRTRRRPVLFSHASIDFFDGGATAATTATARHTATRHVWHATFTASRGLIDLHHDRVHDTLELFLLGFELLLFCQLILVQPVQCVLHGSLNLVLELLLLQSVPHGEAIVFEAVLCFNL